MNYRENQEIDLLDLAKYIFARWKILIIGMVVGAFVVGGYGYYKSGIVVSTSTGKPVLNVEDEINTLKAKLSSNDAKYVEESVRNYFEVMYKYGDNLDYCEKSILMNLDSNNASKIIVEYSINESSNYELANNINSIVSLYRSELTSESVIASIKDTLNVDVEGSYVRELISVDLEGDSILSISVYGVNEDMCRTIFEVIQTNMDTATDKINNIYDFSIVQVADYYSKATDEALREKQLQIIENINTIIEPIHTMTLYMSNDEKNYYAALVRQGESSDRAANHEIFVDEQDDTKILRTLNTKYVFLGIIGGWLLVACLYAAGYMLSSCIHTAEDLKRVFGLSILGEIDEKKVDVSLVSQNISIIANKLSCKKIYITGASGDSVLESVGNRICNNLVEIDKTIEVRLESSVTNDTLSMKYLSDSDSVVLVERRGCSAYTDIEKEIEVCKQFGVKIIGAVVIR